MSARTIIIVICVIVGLILLGTGGYLVYEQNNIGADPSKTKTAGYVCSGIGAVLLVGIIIYYFMSRSKNSYD
jgi:hypothetical protein